MGCGGIHYEFTSYFWGERGGGWEAVRYEFITYHTVPPTPFILPLRLPTLPPLHPLYSPTPTPHPSRTYTGRWHYESKQKVGSGSGSGPATEMKMIFNSSFISSRRGRFLPGPQILNLLWRGFGHHCNSIPLIYLENNLMFLKVTWRRTNCTSPT